VYNSDLIKQGYESFCNILGKEGMYVLSKGSDIMDLNYDKINGLFLTQAMLESIIKTYGIETISEIICNKMNLRMKIIDEVDRNVATTYKLEVYFNFQYNLYLTGTPYRNLQTDNRVFQIIYKSVLHLGDDVKVPANKNIYFVRGKMNPTRKEFMKIRGWNESMFKIEYNNIFARKDIFLDFIMDKMYVKDESLMKKMLDEDGRIVFFVGRIENCEIVAKKLHERFGIDEDDIGIVNSSKSLKENEENKNKKFIVSTTQKIGRGYDDKRIRVIVLLEFTFARSEITQTLSRVGRVGGDLGHVVYPVDLSFTQTIDTYNKRKRENLFSEGFIHQYGVDIPEEFASNYIHGYRKYSKEAMDIEKEKKASRKGSNFYKYIKSR
jgi:hypothetical protein